MSTRVDMMVETLLDTGHFLTQVPKVNLQLIIVVVGTCNSNKIIRIPINITLKAMVWPIYNMGNIPMLKCCQLKWWRREVD